MSYNDFVTFANAIRLNDPTETENLAQGVQWINTSDISIGSGADFDFIMEANGNNHVRIMSIEIASNATAFELRLFEDVAFTGGTPIPFERMNRISAIEAFFVVTAGGTISDDGNQFYFASAGGGDKKKIVTSEVQLSVIFNKDKDYLFRISNLDGGAQDFSVSSVAAGYFPLPFVAKGLTV